MKEKVYKESKRKYEFVPYDGEFPPCIRCAFEDASIAACESHPCRKNERSDGKNGYYRHANANLIVTVKGVTHEIEKL